LQCELAVMFQVNGHSLVGASHCHAVQVFRSAGSDIVAVVSRPRTSPPSSAPCDRPPTAGRGPCPPRQPNSDPHHAVTGSVSRTKTALPPQWAKNPPSLSEPLCACLKNTAASSLKLADQQSRQKRSESSGGVVTVADSLAGPSCLGGLRVKDGPLQSSSPTAPGFLWPVSPSNTAQQADTEADRHVPSSFTLRDSQPRDKVSWF